MTYVTACIDGSVSAPAVCDYASWATLRLDAPLRFLHVLDQRQYPTETDLSGNIGLGSREHLLEELASLDEQRGKLALEQGRVLLSAAKERAVADGISTPEGKQRHGSLLESLQAMESEIRLLVIGRQGETSSGSELHVGSQLESVIRLMHRPVLATPAEFTPPKSAMLAFDGSESTKKGVKLLANSPLFKGLPIHLVMIGEENAKNQAQLDEAAATLNAKGHTVQTALRQGDVEQTLHDYQNEQQIDLLIMGAYGHSRIRQFFVGSTTTNMLETAITPILLLR
ncbi:universal stress protein [Suttonella sp. R2A3]|uniref:universal stress protein n=1 Tax=Suttonella sp. R2A3 TaxID=2908648 RepID=UPI001F47A960|nr:universal stress protein [Suttonella sp. R2A3]UJF24880.1 universal stress protein [Suttonella sp. R2A3]